jgi:hypothetical protein
LPLPKEKTSMKKQSERSRLNLRAGDIVKIRSFDEISSTLGDDGTMEGLPFQPEMQKYCGGSFRVLRPVKKLIIENANTGLRGIRNTVLLDGINCDGQRHHDCSRYCFFLWREAWLKKAGHQQHPANQPTNPKYSIKRPPHQALSPPAIYCQSMALVKATCPLPIWNLKQYIWDISDNNLPPLKRVILISVSLARHIKKLLRFSLPIRLGSHLDKTPSVDFSLQPGDLVEIKNLDEITATLDSSGRNRGLAFTKEMKKFCGHKFSVLRYVDRIIVEGTGEMRKLSNTVILNAANCDGQPHFGCGRNCYLMWRKIWLRKI